MAQLELEVQSVKGYCSAGCQVGQKFIFNDPVITPQDNAPLCLYALSAMFPYLTAACRETPADDWINQVKVLQCPDNENTVVFSIKRVP
ncbi:TIGR04076 family protein [Desulfoscipio gibsoniae]|uniref:TIGR04076 family protein n=1 Tax=Desulfoscipio gibsoniae DSM 7213 TaxID=767817 RepID=R4KPA9_9FIRM|nr:TIGR04076 family protein [Desulfoscipio gibsoniae]AGL03397.1 TIGR04076 family protein [Desulfoscipio gibsoniae DSM 7213]